MFALKFVADKFTCVELEMIQGEKMHRVIYILIMGLVIGCSDTTSSDVDNTQSVVEDASKFVSATYSVTPKDTIPGIKRSLEVHLERKITEDSLREIAIQIKNSDSNKYERTFITYYLPNMEVGEGAWATTHFTPDVEVRILGLTIEEEKILRDYSVDPAKKVVGRWIDEGFKRRITIFVEGDKTFIEYVYTDGSSGIKELGTSKSGNNVKYREVKSEHPEDYYFIDNIGDLYAGDAEGSWLVGTQLE